MLVFALMFLTQATIDIISIYFPELYAREIAINGQKLYAMSPMNAVYHLCALCTATVIVFVSVKIEEIKIIIQEVASPVLKLVQGDKDRRTKPGPNSKAGKGDVRASARAALAASFMDTKRGAATLAETSEPEAATSAEKENAPLMPLSSFKSSGRKTKVYHARLNQLDKMGEHLNYIFFGLTSDASDKDLDNAYRKLAKIMHPDKNGGTEAAKKKFQQMKERYEAIKKKRSEGEDEAESDDGAGPPDEDEGATRELKDRKQKPNDENAANTAEEDADKASSIEYDPQDRGSMEKTVGKMLGQLKNVEIQMKVVVKELGRISTQNPGAFQVP